MAKTDDILYNYGISSSQIVRLYRYGLLDILSSVPGIGCGRIAELQQNLDQAHAQKRLPSGFTWIYKLAIDVFKISTDQSFYHPYDGGALTLDGLREIDSGINTAINDWLSSALSTREQSIIRYLYRDGQTPHEAAHTLGVTYQSLTKMKNTALRKLRAPRNLQTLRGLICIKAA